MALPSHNLQPSSLLGGGGTATDDQFYWAERDDFRRPEFKTVEDELEGVTLSLDNPEDDSSLNHAELSLDTPGGEIVPDQPVAEQRAIKADLAMGERSPGVPALANAMMLGQEDFYRQNHAIQRDLENRKLKLDIIRGLTEAKKAPLTSEEQDLILNLSAEKAQNFKTTFEEDYGRAFVNRAVEVAGPNSPVAKALEKNPDAAYDEANIASHVIAKKELVQKLAETLDAEAKQQGWGSFALDLAASFLPGYSWYLRQNAVKRAPTTSFLPGSNVEEQIAYLFTLPNDDFEAQLSAAVNDIKSKNLTEARDFLRDVAAFSVSDALLDNIFGVADLLTPVDVLTIGAHVARGAREAVKGAKIANEIDRTAKELQQSMRGAVEGAAPTKLELDTALAANGNVAEAARVSAAKTLLGDPLGEGNSLRAQVHSLFNPSKWWNDGPALASERTDRLVAHAAARAKVALEAITKLGKVDRLPEEALQQAFQEAENELRHQYRNLNDGILNVSYNRPEASDANVGSVSILLGNKDGTLFESALIAAHHAQDVYKIPGARIGQQGNGFYIRVDKAIDETTDTVRNLIVTTENTNPSGFINQLLTKFGASVRSADDVVAPFQNKNRKAATYGAQELHRVMKEVAKPITSLSKKEKHNVETILRDNRDFVTHDEFGNVQRGQFHRSHREFDQAYRDRFGKAPSAKEAEAYFTYVQLNDIDYFVRNLGLYRDKARQGIENASYSFTIKNEDGSFVKARTQNFEAKKVDKLPERNAPEDAGILIHDFDNPVGEFIRLRELTDGDLDRINQLVQQQGYQLLQVADPLKKPLASWAGTKETVNFVIASGVERKKLDWKQFDYRPGGHSEYDYGFWVKQPKIARAGEGEHTRHIYEGDTTLHPFHTEAEARKYAERYETARQMLVRGDKGLSEYVQRNLGMSEGKFKELFEPRGGGEGDGRILGPADAFLRLDDPIVFIKEGRATIDDYHWGKKYTNFEDNIRSTYNLWNNIDKKFAGERDDIIKTIKERPDGALEHVPAKNIDPFTTLNRATTNIMRNRLLSDYKISAVEQWVAQYGHLLSVDPQHLKANPVHYLHNPVWDSRASDQALLASAKASRSAILNLLGSDTETGKAFESLKGSVLNEIYKKLGQEASEVVSEGKLWQSRDPLKTARAVAFHTKLGLFAWPQFFTQISTMAHMTAIAPTHAVPGMASGSLMRWLSLNANPETVEHYAKIAEKFGMKREWFKESYDEMVRTGLFNVEGEHAWKNDMFDPKVVETKGQKILDWGTTPFREGERLARLASWNAAYREWRVANPDAQLTNSVRNQLLNRMDTMMVNMTRASNASWQNGVMSIPTQFMGYQIRLMEQMLGGRLTPPEKARVFAMYSTLYGVPVAAGGTVGVNVYEHIREKAIEAGYNGDNLATRALMEGAIDVMWKVITGQDYNVSEKYGPGGINLREIFEKNPLEIALGASGSILGDIANSTDPLTKWVAGVFSPDNDKTYPLKGEDFVDALRNISSANTAIKMVYALNTGKYITKNEVALSEVTPGVAIFSAITGMQPQEVTDIRVLQSSLKHSQEAKDEASKVIATNVRRALQSMADGNQSGFDDYMRRARVYFIAGGFRPDEYGKVMAEALGGNMDLYTKARMQFIKNAPEGKFLERLNQFQK
jgi:hypothetical protein